MKEKLIAILLSLLATLSFWIIVFSKQSAFNFLPYSLYHYIDSNGNNESGFILIFDIVFGIILFFVSYKIIRWLNN